MPGHHKSTVVKRLPIYTAYLYSCQTREAISCICKPDKVKGNDLWKHFQNSQTFSLFQLNLPRAPTSTTAVQTKPQTTMATPQRCPNDKDVIAMTLTYEHAFPSHCGNELSSYATYFQCTNTHTHPSLSFSPFLPLSERVWETVRSSITRYKEMRKKQILGKERRRAKCFIFTTVV